MTLSAKLREESGLKPDDQLIAETTPEGLLLRLAVTLAIEMYSDHRIREFDEADSPRSLAESVLSQPTVSRKSGS